MFKAARDSARAAKAPYGNIFTTTPGYISTDSGKYAYEEVYLKSMRWSELLFDSTDEKELYSYIVKNSPDGAARVLLEYNHRQLGYTDEWLKEKMAEAMSSGENAGADYLNLWAKGSNVSPLSKDILEMIQESQDRVRYSELSKLGYLTNWYISEGEVKSGILNRKLVMGNDTSDAVGKDDIAMCIRDASTGETVAVGMYNETNLISFSEFLAEWLTRFSNLTLIIERRSSGVMIIDNLLRLLPMKGIDPFKRIFNWVVNDCNVNKAYMNDVVNTPFLRRDSSVYIKYRQHFGFATSGSGRQSRDQLYGATFMASTKYTGNVVKDNVLINQIIGLRSKNGRIDHASDSHDDLVVAWLLPYWFLTEANNKSFYGLSSNNILTSVKATVIEESGGQEEAIKREQQQKIRNDIDRLIAELKTIKNPILMKINKNRIQYLYHELDPNASDALNIETVIENMELNKRRSLAA